MIHQAPATSGEPTEVVFALDLRTRAAPWREVERASPPTRDDVARDRVPPPIPADELDVSVPTCAQMLDAAQDEARPWAAPAPGRDRRREATPAAIGVRSVASGRAARRNHTVAGRRVLAGSEGNEPDGAEGAAQTPDVEEPPVAIDTPSPGYPESARRRGETGAVLCRLVVTDEGRVAVVEVLRSSGVTALDEAAVAGVMRWRFRPALRNGAPIACAVRQRVVFSEPGSNVDHSPQGPALSEPRRE